MLCDRVPCGGRGTNYTASSMRVGPSVTTRWRLGPMLSCRLQAPGCVYPLHALNPKEPRGDLMTPSPH